MGNPYPIALRDTSDVERFSGEATFTDPANQPGNGGSSAVLKATLQLTAAELNALPVVDSGDPGGIVVATPGAGSILFVLGAACSSAAPDGGLGVTLQLNYGSAAGADGLGQLNPSDTADWETGWGASGYSSFDNFDKPIMAYRASDDVATNGPFLITLFYVVIDTP